MKKETEIQTETERTTERMTETVTETVSPTASPSESSLSSTETSSTSTGPSSTNTLSTTDPLSNRTSKASPESKEGIKIGVAVGVSLGVLIIAFIGIFGFWRERRLKEYMEDLKSRWVPVETYMNQRGLDGGWAEFDDSHSWFNFGSAACMSGQLGQEVSYGESAIAIIFWYTRVFVRIVSIRGELFGRDIFNNVRKQPERRIYLFGGSK